MASVSIADLTISIKDNSKQAAEKVLNLAAALEELRNKQAGSGALKTVANDIATLKSADMGGLVRLRKQLASATVYAERLATAMDKVVKASGSVKLGRISAQAAKQSVTSNSANMVSPTATEATGTTSSVDKALEKRMQAARATIQALEQQADLQRQMSGWIEESQRKYGASIPLSEKFKNAIVGVGQAGVSVFHRLLPQGMIRTLNQLGRLMKMRILRTIVKSLLAGFTEGLQNCYYWAKATGDQFASSMDTISTSMNYAKNSIGAAFSNIINIIAPVIDQVVDWLVVGINYINMFFAALTGATEYTKARKIAVEYGKAAEGAIGGASAAAKDLKEQLTVLDFDELHQLQEQQTPSTGGGGGGGSGSPAQNYSDMFEKVPIDSWMLENFQDILDLVTAIGTAILGWKLSTAFTNSLTGLQKLGISMMVGGLVLEGLSAYDMGKNGINLKNIIKTAGGALAAILGGVFTFGATSLLITVPLTIVTFLTGFIMGGVDAAKEKYKNDPTYAQLRNMLDESFRKLEEVREIRVRIKNIKIEYDEKMTNIETAQNLLDKLKVFDGLENPTDSDLSEIKRLVGAINQLNLDGVNAQFDVLNGKVQINVEELQKALDALKEMAKQTALFDLYVEQAKAEVALEQAKNRLRTDYELGKAQHDADVQTILDAYNTPGAYVSRQWKPGDEVPALQWSMNPEVAEAMQGINDYLTTLSNDADAMYEAKAALEDVNEQLDIFAGKIAEVGNAAKLFTVPIVPTVYEKANKSLDRPVVGGSRYDLQRQFEQVTNGSPGLNIFADPSKNANAYIVALDGAADAAEEASQSQRYYNTALDNVPRVGNAGTNTFREYAYQLGDVSTATDEARTATSDFDTVLTHVGDGVNLKPVQNKFKTDLSSDFFTPIGKGARVAIEDNINAISADGKKIYPQVSDPILKEDYAGTGSTIQTAVQSAINAIHANGKTIYDTVNSNITSKDYGAVGGTVQSKVQAKINAITADGKGIKERIGGQFTYYSAEYSKMGSDTGDTIRKGMVTGLAATTLAKGIYDGLKEAVDSAGFSWIGRAIGNYIKSGIGTALNGSELSITMKIGTSQKTYTGRVVSASLYAQGGFPQAGDIFVANEKTAEMVGSIGGRPAVVNNEQIASALARALQPMLTGAGGQQTTNVEVKLDSATIAKASMKGQRAMNRQFNVTARA